MTNKTLKALEQLTSIDCLIIHSLEPSIYQASVLVEGSEYYIVDEQQHLLRDKSILGMQKQCKHLKANKQVLRQQSAYDEMIGGPPKAQNNVLEVPLSQTNSLN